MLNVTGSDLMIVFLSFQLLFNIVVIAGVLLSYRRLFRREAIATPQVAPQPVPTVDLTILDDKCRAFEEELRRYRHQMTSQLKELTRICDEAARLLSRGAAREAAFTPSLEEDDLKFALRAAQTRHDLPTLKQLERNEIRSKAEVNLDLRSLLRDQLA